jgi:chemotaxis protein histidine kinase CheA
MEALEQRIRELKQRYALTLPDRVASIGNLLLQAGEQAVVRAELLRQFHTLAGTAGTFGYNDVAALACEAEGLLSSVATPEVTPDEVEHVACRLVDLDEVIHRDVGCYGLSNRTALSFLEQAGFQ